MTMNAAIRGYQQSAKRGKLSRTQERRLSEFFAGDAERINQLKKDLANEVKSDDVVLLGWNILLDYQPLDSSELPQGYQNHGNLRIFYMLKTFMLKRWDVVRRESFREIKLGVEKRDYKRVIAGLSKLMWLYMIWWLGGASFDFIRDYMTGKEPEVGDTLFASSIKVLGFNRYLWYDFQRHGDAYQTAAMFVGFPVPWIQQPARDINDIVDGDFNLADAETARIVPFIGSLYYWMLGGGESRQREDDRKETRKRMREMGVTLP